MSIVKHGGWGGPDSPIIPPPLFLLTACPIGLLPDTTSSVIRRRPPPPHTPFPSSRRRGRECYVSRFPPGLLGILDRVFSLFPPSRPPMRHFHALDLHQDGSVASFCARLRGQACPVCYPHPTTHTPPHSHPTPTHCAPPPPPPFPHHVCPQGYSGPRGPRGVLWAICGGPVSSVGRGDDAEAHLQWRCGPVAPTSPSPVLLARGGQVPMDTRQVCYAALSLASQGQNFVRACLCVLATGLSGATRC